MTLSGTRHIDDLSLSMGKGGLAGKATTEDALRILGDVAERAAGRLAIKASGAVFSGADAVRFLSAGATSMEIYSAFIYRGWDVAKSISAELAAELEARGLGSVAALAPPARTKLAVGS